MSLQNTNGEILLAGACAALAVDILLYPLDTLKTRYQSRDYARLFANNRPALFRGMYQGAASVIVASLPSSAVFFASYEGIKVAFAEDRQTAVPQPIVHSAASCVSELVACAISAPAEIIKQNAQMVTGTGTGATGKSSATLATLRTFRASPRALWSGYVALIARDLPFSAIQFPLYERMRVALSPRGHEQGLAETAAVTALSSALASGVASVLTTPVDVVKTRIMLDAGAAAAAAANPLIDAHTAQQLQLLQTGQMGAVARPVVSATAQLRPGWASTAHDIFVHEGVRGLWRGGTLRCVWTMLGGGLYLGVYESGRLWLARRRHDSEQ